MTTLLNELQTRIPNVREVMLAALKNVRTTHLLDVNATRAEPLSELDPDLISPEALHTGLIQLEGK